MCFSTFVFVGYECRQAMLRCFGAKRKTMEHNEVEVKKLGPIVETIWGIFLLAMSGVLIFIGG